MKITTRYKSDYEYVATTAAGHKVNIDMRDNGKADQSPMEMVLSALTGCIAVEISLIMKKRRKQVADLIIEAEGQRKEDAPRSFTGISLLFTLVSEDATVEELEKATKLTIDKYCSVAESLKAEISFQCKVERP